MEWMIHELATRAGTTSRALRHYDRIGLLAPSRVGENGYRYYGPESASRLDRILRLRRLGMGLPEIAEALAEEDGGQGGLRAHVAALEAERDRVEQRLREARLTLEAAGAGAEPGANVLLEGFNDRYRDEVVERWGEEAFRASNEWWHAKTLKEQVAWKEEAEDLVAAWVGAWRSGVSPSSETAQGLAARHVRWLAGIPGTPQAEGDRERSVEMVRCLGDSYVEDPRFVLMYQGPEGAAFVRDALHAHARTRM
ncbi:TipAS antibiotic-recognition domain-containing protein [Nocardiopsis sp. CNT-189]